MKLLSWGANTHGQLGHGTTADHCLLPQAVDIETMGLKPRDIKYITGGGGHSFILDNSGKLYGCGSNTNGQLGIKNSAVHTFQLIETLSIFKIVQISCGWDSSVALCDSGQVFVWGSNKFNQLGLKNILKTDVPLELEIKATHVSMGLRHLAIVGTNGYVYTAGSGIKGQLGVVDLSGNPIKLSDGLIEITNLRNIVSVACGQNHTIALDKSGCVYGWGDNRFNQLGSSRNGNEMLPIILKDFSTSENLEIHCGWTHNAVLLRNGSLRLWGRNTYGQCTKTEKTTDITSVQEIESVSLGSEHCLAINNKGHLLAWGWNEHGNCGTGNEIDVFEPILVTINCLLIGTGYGHSFAVVE